MNPYGGSGGRANANNQNYWSPHLPSQTQERLLPLFPVIATEEGFLGFPQQGVNNNGPNVLRETPNVVASGSNIFSSSSLSGTPPNRSANLDLSLEMGLSGQGATTSHAVIQSSSAAPSVHGSNSNTVNSSRKRSLPGNAPGNASGNASGHTEEPKRPDTEPEARATHNVIPQNAGRSIPPTNTRGDWMDNTNQTRGSLAQPFIPTHPHHSPLQPSPSVQPLAFHSGPFMPTPASTANTITARNAPYSIFSPFPPAGVDIMIPFYEHGNMFGPVITSMGNFPTYRPNRSYLHPDGDTARRALSFVLPHHFEPPEPMQLLPGIVGNGGIVSNAPGNMYHPLRDYPSSSTWWFPPQGPQVMHHSAAASSSGSPNHHSLMRVSPSATPPNGIHEPAFPLPQFPSEETRRRLPNDVRSILDSLRNGHALRFEDLMILDYSLVLRAFEIEHPELFETSRSSGLSLETITQYMECETFLVIDGGDSEETRERCPICLEEFDNGEEIGKLNLCVHKFHLDCIKNWLNRKNLCPVCRRTALETHDDQNVGGRAAAGAVLHIEDGSE